LSNVGNCGCVYRKREVRHEDGIEHEVAPEILLKEIVLTRNCEKIEIRKDKEPENKD
jgi:hypothetical protein